MYDGSLAVSVGVHVASKCSAFWILPSCWTCNVDFLLVSLIVWGLGFCFFFLSHSALLSSGGVNCSNCYFI